MDEEVKQRRLQLKEAIRNIVDPSESILGLIEINCPLSQKFARLKGFGELLKNNSKSGESLRQLVTMLNILEKYGRHLLKPADQRSSMWRHVKNSNTIYRERVAKIWGGSLLMTMMGYTEERPDGVAFPEGSEPNHDEILDLLGDIILGRKELELYSNGNHPHPQHIEEHLSKELLSVLKPHINKDIDTSNSSNTSQEPAFVTARSQSSQSQASGLTSFKRQLLDNKEKTAQQSEEVQNENRAQSIVCDICGKNQADMVCHICDNKQLCSECDTKWHSHPKRQNHERQHLREPQAPQPCGGSRTGTPPQRKVLGELPQGETEGVYIPPPQHSVPPTMSSHHYYQSLIRLGTAPSSGFEQMMYQIPSSGAHLIPASVPQTPLMYQAQYPPPHISSQPRLIHGMWPHSQPGSGQYFHPNQMLAAGQVSRSSHMTGDSHVSSVQYPFSIAGGFRDRQEVRGSFPGYVPDQNQSHTLAYIPTSYAGGTPSPGSADLLSVPRYQTMPPPDQSDIGSHANKGNAEFLFQYQNKQKNDDSYEIPKKTGDMGKRQSMQLVSNLQSIADLQRRKAKLEIYLESIMEETYELDSKINQIILVNENFIHDHEYTSLSRMKQKFLREHKELKIYAVELDKLIAENAEFSQKMQEGSCGEGTGIQYHGPSITNVTFPPNARAIPPDEILKHPAFITGQNREKSLPTGVSASGEETYRNTEEEKRMSNLRRMLLLNQNPFAHPQAKQEELKLNIPVTEARREGLQKSSADEGVSYPPQIIVSSSSDKETQHQAEKKSKAIGMSHEVSEPNLRRKGNEAEHMRKASSECNLQQWECEYCTYANKHSSNICDICSKTNDNKKMIRTSVDKKEASGFGAGDSDVEKCKKCTFGNEKGDERCKMCGEFLGQPTAALKIDVGGDDGKKLEVPNVEGASQNNKGAVSPKVSSLEQKLEEEQDQVFLEKKLAQQRYKESLDAEASRNNAALPTNAGSKNKKGKTPSTGEDESSFVFVEPGSSLLLTEGVPLQAEYVGPKKILNKKLAALHKSPHQSPPNSNEEFFFTPPTSFDQVQPRTEGHLNDRRPPANVNFSEAIEHIQMRRAREQMWMDGYDFVTLLKAAEKEGYSFEEIEIAVTRSIDDKMKPLDWLKQKWAEQIEAVIDMVLQSPKNEDVGDLSRAEAKEELIKCKGDLKKASDACIHCRKQKFEEICGEGKYLKENILTALYQNAGSVEKTIDQLNSYVIKGFSDHVWADPDYPDSAAGASSPQGDLVRAGEMPMVVAGVGAVGGQAALANDGPVNSVIAKEEFQEMIKNKAVNKERRIRTVFVEGKLQSWGRAETVIKILDDESAQLDDILECSLEDIIEAVKNCGDKKTSLAYLRQDCGICFSCYPMNKIQNLNSCQCKMCRYCLKQNFEVAIREKYVRHWVCPLCQEPNLEDETVASAYFEFLQLLLRHMMDGEIKDLFETKLRDWHLQKEKNFRWCAHCASGFVWDRPTVLQMKCPSCDKKTCFRCKKKWEDQHQGLTCEEFTQWKLDNDPDNQAKGLARHLEENGIDCPSCKMRYDLAKGGCMHFRCPQCGHEFCSGCSEPFMQDGTCKLLKDCKGKGLHCHHPRDCFYYLRDNDCVDLQELLKQNRVEYNTEVPSTQKDPKHCPVMEQKELGANKKDEACGKDTEKGMAGLCHMHYKEYLVGLINKNKVDPADIMSVKELERCFARMGKQMPKLNKNENETQYKQRMTKLIKDSFPLRR